MTGTEDIPPRDWDEAADAIQALLRHFETPPPQVSYVHGLDGRAVTMQARWQSLATALGPPPLAGRVIEPYEHQPVTSGPARCDGCGRLYYRDYLKGPEGRKLCQHCATEGWNRDGWVRERRCAGCGNWHADSDLYGPESQRLCLACDQDRIAAPRRVQVIRECAECGMDDFCDPGRRGRMLCEVCLTLERLRAKGGHWRRPPARELAVMGGLVASALATLMVLLIMHGWLLWLAAPLTWIVRRMLAALDQMEHRQ